MKRVMIASFDMEIGGVERSLISLLEQVDDSKYYIDLMLYRHQGEFFSLIPQKVTVLKEIQEYTTFRKSIAQILQQKHYKLALARTRAKLEADIMGKVRKITEPGYYQMQLMWKHAIRFLPEAEKEYDVAISYLWPHYYVAEKVKASRKIAWIHTDFSHIETDEKEDLRIWDKFDCIVAVSEACKQSFISKYTELKNKVTVIENVFSAEFIQKMSLVQVNNPLESDPRFKIITVARLSHAKGIDKAIKALKLLRLKGYHNMAWYVIGYGGEEKKLEQLISEHDLQDSFILLGKKVNPYPYVKSADLYVQPSRYEGKAVTVTEAKILQKPVLITHYPTSSSQVEHGSDGMICGLNEVDICKGIERLYNDENLRDEISANCKETYDSSTKELEAFYKIMMAENSHTMTSLNYQLAEK